MLDQLVYGQDMAAPVGRTREMSREAAAVAGQCDWDPGWAFRVKRRLHGFSLAATDHPWSIGVGPVVEAPVQALLMLVTGRDVLLPELAGPSAPAARTARRSGPDQVTTSVCSRPGPTPTAQNGVPDISSRART